MTSDHFCHVQLIYFECHSSEVSMFMFSLIVQEILKGLQHPKAKKNKIQFCPKDKVREFLDPWAHKPSLFSPILVQSKPSYMYKRSRKPKDLPHLHVQKRREIHFVFYAFVSCLIRIAVLPNKFLEVSILLMYVTEKYFQKLQSVKLPFSKL